MPDPESITPLLAERLDISTDRAETLLQSMIQELKSRAASEGVHLSELGTFEEEDGTLSFTPSPSLRRRVNHQFEGLSPEDLSGPPSARPAEEAPPSLRDSSGDEAETAPSPAEPSPPEPQSPPEPSPSARADDESIPTLDPIEKEEDTEPAESSPEPPGEPEEPPYEPAGASSEPDDETDQSIPTLDPIEDEAEDEGDEADAPPPDDSPEEELPEEDEEDEEVEPASPMGSFSVIGSLLLFVLLLGIGWVVLTQTNVWSSSQPPSETSEAETTQSADPGTSPESSGPDEASGDDQPDRYAGVRPGDDAGETPGPAADTGSGTWTVVVASLSSRTEAEALAADYEDHFATVEVMRTTDNDRTGDQPLYRVAVGRYDSEVAANRAREQNASVMPSDAWLHELP